MASYELDDASVVVVIGSGAGGGVLSNELAQQGVDVVCLEAGGRLGIGDFVNDVPTMFGKFTWLDPRTGTGDVTPEFPVFLCKTVGGTTVHWTALSLRGTPTANQARTHYGDVEGASLIDWPITYKEMSAYWDKAEDKMGVSGTHDMPLHPGNNNFLVLKAGAEKLGYTDITTASLAINSVVRDGRPACIQLGFCMSGCAVGAKWSTLYTEIPKAEATGHFEIRPHSMVLRVETDDSGRASGVVYADADGNIQRQKAKIVCVAGNSIETARLLLNSESNRFPDGLGNQTGNVGRYYMRHVFGRVFAEMPGKVSLYKGIQQAGSLPHEDRHDPSRGFAGGYHLETAPMTPEQLAKSLAAPKSGSGFTDVMEKYDYFAGGIICGEDFPVATNRVTLHPDRKDRHGLPIANVHYEDHKNALAMRAHAVANMSAMYEAVGANKVYVVPMRGGTHNMGTCRMAETERDGVSDRWGRVFSVPNLFVSDGSQFSTSQSANPTLTVVALAIRQAEYIAGQIGRDEL